MAASAMVVLVAVAAGVWLAGDGGDDADTPEFAVLVETAVGSGSFELVDADGGGRETFNVSKANDSDEVTILPAGRGRALVMADDDRLLVPLDGSEPTDVAGGWEFPVGLATIHTMGRLEGVLVGDGPAAEGVLEFASGEIEPLDDLVEGEAPVLPTGYSADGRLATVQAEDQQLSLVPLTGDEEPRSLGQGNGGFSPDGEHVAFVRGERESASELVLVDPDTGDEEVLWSGDGPVLAVWSGDVVALVGADSATLVDPQSGDESNVIAGVELEPTSAYRTGGALVSSADDERRWYRLDTGAEVSELRGLEPPERIRASGAEWVMFVAPDDESAVAAWNPVDGVAVELDGTDTELELLAGSEFDLRQSPDGRFVVTTFAGGDDEPVVLADLETGQVTALDGVIVAGEFSPDGQFLLVRRSADEGRGTAAIVETAAPNLTGVELGTDVGTAAWVFP